MSCNFAGLSKTDAGRDQQEGSGSNLQCQTKTVTGDREQVDVQNSDGTFEMDTGVAGMKDPGRVFGAGWG